MVSAGSPRSTGHEKIDFGSGTLNSVRGTEGVLIYDCPGEIQWSRRWLAGCLEAGRVLRQNARTQQDRVAQRQRLNETPRHTSDRPRGILMARQSGYSRSPERSVQDDHHQLLGRQRSSADAPSRRCEDAYSKCFRALARTW